MSSKVLLVEDNVLVQKSIQNSLSKDFEIITTDSASTAIDLMSAVEIDIYVIDIFLCKKEMTGLDLCKTIREKDKDTPILFLTGKNSIEYKLKAFDLGADDYLCKPFNLLELKVRINNLLKKRKPNNKSLQAINAKNIKLNSAARTVKVDKTEISLSTKEYEILELLQKNIGKTITRDVFLATVWCNTYINNNIVDVYIRKIRKKLGDTNKQKYIQTVHGYGYKISA